MPKNYALVKLNAEMKALREAHDMAFRAKQDAWIRFKSARDQADAAHDAMQQAWDERVRTRDEMNREFEARKEAFATRDAVWDEYGRVRDRNNADIEFLKREADSEHYAMKDCFDRASAAYEYGDKSEAPYYSQEGHAHKDRRDELNARISELAQEAKDARAYAEAHAPKVDSSAFDRAKTAFEKAKARHEAAEAEFKRLKAERDRLKKVFDDAQDEFKTQDRLLKDKKAERQKVQETTGATIRYGTFDGYKAKFVEYNDGSNKTQVFFGGSGPDGDGEGHGHATISSAGQVTYLRNVGQDRNDWQINDRANLPDKKGRIRFPGEHTKI
ncbi:MAG: DUF1771 domain-containing protein [Candidatus Saccharibacteria bacterium]|nr:DUF1771 domain-containing protein [Candidatus Saccharibacteria bacterium]